MAKSGTNGPGKGQFGRIRPENGIPGPAGAIQTGIGAQNRPKPAKKKKNLADPGQAMAGRVWPWPAMASHGRAWPAMA